MRAGASAAGHSNRRFIEHRLGQRHVARLCFPPQHTHHECAFADRRHASQRPSSRCCVTLIKTTCMRPSDMSAQDPEARTESIPEPSQTTHSSSGSTIIVGPCFNNDRPTPMYRKQFLWTYSSARKKEAQRIGSMSAEEEVR